MYCALDDAVGVVERGEVPTTAATLSALVKRHAAEQEVIAGQEVGTMCHFVHDVVSEAGARILSFNAQQLRMIASSRKKTDKRAPE